MIEEQRHTTVGSEQILLCGGGSGLAWVINPQIQHRELKGGAQIGSPTCIYSEQGNQLEARSGSQTHVIFIVSWKPYNYTTGPTQY